MDRRAFMKNTLAAATVVWGLNATAKASPFEKTESTAGNKKGKILVLTGSPRKGGNSSVLPDYFIKGAQEAGHETERFDAAFKSVHPCIECNRCRMDGPCIFKDDFEFVRNNIIDADAVVFATPMYYFGISARLKAVIDRFYAINGKIHVPQKAVLLMTYANTAASEAVPIESHYDVLLRYLGWHDTGRVIASGVWPIGAVNRTKYPEQAYELGKNMRF